MAENVAPRFADATQELALVARDLRDGRAAGDPKMVAEGKLTEDEVAERLRVAAALATDWACYAALRLPPLDGATGAEKEAMLVRSLAVTTARRDKARTAMIEQQPVYGRLERGALWQLVDAHLPDMQRVAAYLDRESYAAAIEAMLWWQRRTGVASKRWAVETTIAAHAMVAAEPARAAA